MKAVILCGGKGSRLVEMTDVLPKPMLPVGGKPLLQHIMDIYRRHGVDEFVLPLGYKKEHILAHLLTLHPMDVFARPGYQQFIYATYQVSAVDTGLKTQTGGRLKRVQHLLDGPFHFTYGDGLSNVDLHMVEAIACSQETVATITLVHPEGRFGRAVLDKLFGPSRIAEFGEKADTTDWINGGFSVLQPEIFDYIRDDQTNLEKDTYPSGIPSNFQSKRFPQVFSRPVSHQQSRPQSLKDLRTFATIGDCIRQAPASPPVI